MINVHFHIVTPVYNGEKFISKCLQSVINQTYSKWHMYVVNDASTDTTSKVVEKLTLNDKRIHLENLTENKGPGYARNKAINLMKSKLKMYESSDKHYIIFLDADDWVENYYLEKLEKLVSENNSDIVFIDLIQENEQGKLIKHETMSSYAHEKKDKIIRHQMTGKFLWGGVRKVVKADIILDNDIKYSLDAIGEEALYSFQLVLNSSRIDFLGIPVYHYVNRAHSQSKTVDINPYGPVYDKVKSYLINNNLYSMYEKTLNSLGYTALVVSLYRICTYYNFKEAMKLSRESLDNYKKEIDFNNLDKDSLEKRSKLLLPLVKTNSLFMVFIISKFKYFLSNRK